MNREQMIAWCALEGLTPASCGGYPRVIRADHVIGDKVLCHNKALNNIWTCDISNWDKHQYQLEDWEFIPGEAFAQLTIELLTELTKT